MGLSKLHSAFVACDASSVGALSPQDFLTFFKGFLRSSLRHLECQDGNITEQRSCANCWPEQQLIVRPFGPGASLTPDDLITRWKSLSWRRSVVEFKGSVEREHGTAVRCFSNFFDEIPFDFTVPRELCASSLELQEDECTIR